MKVSVITPVYNAAGFVTQAVESALQQPETAEILLIEDGSPDNALEVCQRLDEKYEKVRLLRHPNGQNRGAGASRNLGMVNSSFEYLAFLDADDTFLPGRFTAAEEIFTADPQCEGVYEPVGLHIENDAGLQRWKNSNKPIEGLTGLKGTHESKKLAQVLLSGEFGSLHLDGLTLRRIVLEKVGYMVEDLRLHQDTEFIIRVATVARLLPGRQGLPVAMRGVHDHNRISAPRSETQKYHDRMGYWMAVYRWCRKGSFVEPRNIVISHMVLDALNNGDMSALNRRPISRARQRYMALFSWLKKNPEVMSDLLFWRTLGGLFIGRGKPIST